MSRKRSAYRPRAVLSDPLSLMRPASKRQRDQLMARYLAAVEMIARDKHPGPGEWRDLSDAINTVETLATLRKLDPAEVMPAVNAAIAAMVGAADRYTAGKAMRFDAAGLEAVREVLSIYGQCLDGYTEREMAMARAETERRVRECQRMNKPGHTVVQL